MLPALIAAGGALAEGAAAVGGLTVWQPGKLGYKLLDGDKKK